MKTFVEFGLVRRRIAAKKRKLKLAGKSKSTDTEDESTYEYCEDDGNIYYFVINCTCSIVCMAHRFLFQFQHTRKVNRGERGVFGKLKSGFGSA